MKDLTKGNISKNLWALALPTLIAEMFNYALSIIDQVMLGKIVGDVGLAAVGATRSYFNILWGFEGSLVFAFGSHLAVLVGQGDGGSIKRAYKINMRMNVLFGFAIAVCSIAFWRPRFSFLNVPADVFEQAKRSGYVRVRVDGNLYELSEEIKLEKNKSKYVLKSSCEKRRNYEIYNWWRRCS